MCSVIWYAIYWYDLIICYSMICHMKLSFTLCKNTFLHKRLWYAYTYDNEYLCLKLSCTASMAFIVPLAYDICVMLKKLYGLVKIMFCKNT